MDDFYDIYFSGRLLPDNDLAEVKKKVGAMFNANPQVLEQLFSGQPVKIKKSVDMDTAIKYRVKFRDIGAIVDIRPSEQTTPAQKVDKAPIKETATETPSNTSIDASLAQPGELMDNTPAPPPVTINTDDLELGPAQGASLEEFAVTVEPMKIADISGLDINASNSPLDETPQAPPALIDVSDLEIDKNMGPLDESPQPEAVDIDISQLSASEANTGSLEEFNQRPEIKPLPDISQLKLE